MLKSKCEILSNIQTMCVRGGEGAKRVLRAADISAFSNVQVVIVNHKLSSGDLLISLFTATLVLFSHASRGPIFIGIWPIPGKVMTMSHLCIVA